MSLISGSYSLLLPGNVVAAALTVDIVEKEECGALMPVEQELTSGVNVGCRTKLVERATFLSCTRVLRLRI